MTTEQAIERLQLCLECTDCYTCAQHDQAIGLAIHALGELIDRHCSRCGQHGFDDYQLCPGCGAKMNGERHEFLRIGRCNHCGYTKQKTSKYQQRVGWSYCPTCKGLCVKWETVDGGADNG